MVMKIEKKKDEDERVEAGRLVQKCQGLMEENGCMKDQISGLSSQLKSKQMEFSKQSLEKDLKYEEVCWSINDITACNNSSPTIHHAFNK